MIEWFGSNTVRRKERGPTSSTFHLLRHMPIVGFQPERIGAGFFIIQYIPCTERIKGAKGG